MSVSDKLRAIADDLYTLARQLDGAAPSGGKGRGRRTKKAAMRGGGMGPETPYPAGMLAFGGLLDGTGYVPASDSDFKLADGPAPFSASGDPSAGLLLGGVPSAAINATLPSMMGGAKKRAPKGAKPAKRK